ncbi:glycosyltransferase [Amycolatopsis mongoliensis]|uniref:Glycosyltransferase n=1 Tax=Amycolatopsis mongoliensis TaxID=715475 RepID=A0A9Y2ND72_9PSEU|nr:glycosyltransferase [Amycolatopsis sp. 4-36]WIY00377.1 glycosyltransferase [Amycolatopsis sp. 4-36]
MQTVDVGELSVAAYRKVAPDWVVEPLLAVAERLRGARVIHLSATPYGGGVSELLRSAVPLYNDLGVHATWKIISGEPAFFAVTKKLHNALQGGKDPITDADIRLYEENSRRNAEEISADPDFAGCDFVFVHDPQPAAILSFSDFRRGKSIWRCHIDTSQPAPSAWGYLGKFVEHYDATVFTMAQFVPPTLSPGLADIISPAIDPLSPKNMSLDDRTAHAVLNWIGIEPDRPLVTQVSRFDPWKDPLGVIDAFRLVRPEVPGLQLALVGSMALDDPEGWEVYRRISDATRADPDIHVFTNLTGVGNVEVNAFQRFSSVMIQKSIREGFGLVVSEALWKGTPIVAGRTGGIPLQVADDTGGLLVDSTDECAKALLGLLQDPGRSAALGASGRERVRQYFLLPRLLLDELTLLDGLAHDDPPGALMSRFDHRDPVCGLGVPPGAGTPSAIADGHTYSFCSQQCRTAFLRARSGSAS